jgi:hypothetical protein
LGINKNIRYQVGLAFLLPKCTVRIKMDSDSDFDSDSEYDLEYDLEYSESLLSNDEELPESSSQLLPAELPPSKLPPSEPKLSPSKPSPSKPLPSRTSIPRHSIGARIQAITLLELGIPH